MSIRRAYPYALFLILVCVFLWRPIFAGRALLPGDYLAEMKPWNTVVKPSASSPQWNPLQWDAIAQFYPWRVLYARSMSSGKIPLWNPYEFHGTPFLANGQSAVLYPPNVVFLLFDPITGFTVFAALHLFLAAVFTYMLLRALGCRELGAMTGRDCLHFLRVHGAVDGAADVHKRGSLPASFASARAQSGREKVCLLCDAIRWRRWRWRFCPGICR